MRVSVLLSSLLVAVACAPDISRADPITFIHTGSGSGTLGGAEFGAVAPLPFTITATGDTDDRQTAPHGVFFIDHLTASISIDGLLDSALLIETRTYVNNTIGSVGFSRAGVGGFDLFNGPQIPLPWDMLTTIGPISGNGFLTQWTSNDVLTTGGVLVFNQGDSSATFQAIVGEPVPEPTTLTLLTTGLLAGLSARRWRQRKP
jgi:hypothetical protein